ncbi:RNA-binding protein [Acetobacteraceae bacterium]|nr:RNA-binding protein [Acetobacteraceae bacterium]
MSVRESYDLLEKNEMKQKSSSRTCLVTRKEGDKRFMIRFVLSPAGDIIPDLAGKLPGRGLWLSALREVVESPKLKQAFSRGAKTSVVTQGDELSERLVKTIEEGLSRRLVEGIGLARKAGNAVTGFQKCREKLNAGRAGLLIYAKDASVEELRRLRSGWMNVPVCSLDARILEEAFAKENAVYAVISSGPLAERLLADATRFIGMAKGQADAHSRSEN